MKKQLKNSPLVSIVMATYNRCQTIERTIKSIFQQSYPNFQLLIINDGSSDDTLFVLRRLQAEFPFQILNNPQNLGLQKSLNRGLQAAKGKYIARIDDHDLWVDADKLKKQVQFLETRPDYALVGTAYHINGTIFTNPTDDFAIRQQILMRCPFCHVTILIRQSILEKTGGYDEKLGYSEDWEMWLKIGQEAKFANLPEVTTEVIEPEVSNSLSGDYFLKQLPLNQQLAKKHAKFYPNSSKAILYHTFLFWFFKIVPVGSFFHRTMQRLFQLFFLKK